MHTFIYPTKNSYITNESGYESKNFSLDSTLEIKSINTPFKTLNLYITQSVSRSVVCDTNLRNFSGSFIGIDNGFITGSSTIAQIYVSGSSNFVTNNFTGVYSASNVVGYSGSITGSHISGSISGIFSGSTTYVSGTFSNFTGRVCSGSIYVGILDVYSPYLTYISVPTKSRTLMQFDLTEISRSISAGDIARSGSLRYFLTLKNSRALELPLSYNIDAHPINQSWSSGDGRYQLGGSDTGVSWTYRDYSDGQLWNVSGSDFITYPSSSQAFNHTRADIKMDITNIANSWISGSITNHGLILITSLESSSMESNNTLKFFGTETNTIYSPYLDVYWDDNVYSTGSLNSITNPYSIAIQNMKSEYKFGSMPRINVFARAQNPLKNFVRGTQFSQYITSSYLPETSYYSIKDNESEEILIDFDDGTKLSCDGDRNYFVFDTTALPQERYYRILIKVIETSGVVNIFDNKNIFKIVR